MSDLVAMELAVAPADKFREFLETKGMRLTPERETIVRAVFARHEHFDTEQLVIDLSQRKGAERASRSTIYRILKLLVEAGLLRRVARSNDREVYEHDYGYPQHDHLICRRCGEMIEFTNEAITQALEEIAQRFGFRMTGHRLEVDGLCATCCQPRRRPHRKLDMI